MSPSAVMATPFTRTARWVTGPRVLPSGVGTPTTRQYIAHAFLGDVSTRPPLGLHQLQHQAFLGFASNYLPLGVVHRWQ